MNTLFATLIVAQFHLFPQGQAVEVTQEHELGVERFTVDVKHYHKVSDGWYLILTDGSELWADNVREVRYATQKRQQPKDSLSEHCGAEEIRKKTGCCGSDCNEQSRKE